VANRLSYLHNYTIPPYVHKDIKSSNVLLDGNLRAKIANFSLAKSAEEEFAVTKHVSGTQGYMVPEYLAHRLVTPKLDVFSFGVVMLELLSDKPTVLLWDGDVMLWTTIGGMIEGSNPMEKLKGFMDLDLKDDYPLEMAFTMARLARTCVHEDLTSRPTISEIQMVLSTWLSTSSPSSL
jgi:serine/threonine protein kinase